MITGKNAIVVSTTEIPNFEASKSLVNDLGLTPEEAAERILPEAIQVKVSTAIEDAEFSRESLRELVGIGVKSSGELYNLAISSQSAKVFTALTEMIKATSQANRELMEVKKIDNELTLKRLDENGESGSKTINQNLIVTMTTNDLANMVKSLTSNTTATNVQP